MLKSVDKKVISVIFEQEPNTWGLRGDPHLWDELKIWLLNHEIPYSSEKFTKLLEKGFEELVGKSISEEGSIYIKNVQLGYELVPKKVERKYRVRGSSCLFRGILNRLQ